MENKRLLTPGEMKRINDGTPPEYRYGDVFQLIAKAQYPLAYQDGSEATADAFIEAGKEIGRQEATKEIVEFLNEAVDLWPVDFKIKHTDYPGHPWVIEDLCIYLKSKYNI